MKIPFLKPMTLLAMLVLLNFTTSCSDNDTPSTESEKDNPKEGYIYTLAQEIDNGDRTATAYIQGFTDLSTGNIDVATNGYEVQSTNAARLFSIYNGYIYNMDYGSADLEKFEVGENTNFSLKANAAAEFAIGTTHPRWKAVNEGTALLHNVVTEAVVETVDGDNPDTPETETSYEKYVETKATARIMSVDLDDLSFGSIQQFEIPKTQTDIDNDYYTFRIDAPIVAGNKAYYGLQKFKYDPDGARIGANHLNIQTLVVDYPSLDNPVMVESGIAGVVGATNGYRTPSMHLDENGDVYQLTGSGPLVHSVNDDDTYFLKLNNGTYDDSYSFNFSDALGRNVASTGWFYAGNGIGYVTYYDVDEYHTTSGDYKNIFWGVARVDLINKTAIELNIPSNLYLLEYQNVVVEEGKVYMALCPIGGTGNIYIFDTASNSADGFTLGASISAGASSFYIGVY